MTAESVPQPCFDRRPFDSVGGLVGSQVKYQVFWTSIFPQVFEAHDRFSRYEQNVGMPFCIRFGAPDRQSPSSAAFDHQIAPPQNRCLGHAQHRVAHRSDHGDVKETPAPSRFSVLQPAASTLAGRGFTDVVQCSHGERGGLTLESARSAGRAPQSLFHLRTAAAWQRLHRACESVFGSWRRYVSGAASR